MELLPCPRCKAGPEEMVIERDSRRGFDFAIGVCMACGFGEAAPWHHFDLSQPELQARWNAGQTTLAAREDGWRPIESAPAGDEFILAATSDGRVMVYRASILARNLAGPTPSHLQFPADWWKPITLPAAPPAQAPK